MPVFQQSSYIMGLIDTAISSQLSAYQQEVSSLHGLEAEFGLYQLRNVMESSRNSQQQTALKNFLKHRWSYLQNTDMQYCHDFQSPLNQVCIKIAGILHSLTGFPTLALLMPSLKRISEDSYVTSPYTDENINLKQIVISDDASRIIFIEDVLDFAILDGRLKHHCVVAGKSEELSTAEVHRVLTRHESVSLLFDIISDKVHHQLHGETAGAYLQRLINGLTLGNVDHNGQENIAGGEAHIAIAEFEHFLSILDEETRDRLMNTAALYEFYSSTPGESYRIMDCWDRLCRQASGQISMGTYCVKIIGSELEGILDSNPELYQMTAFHDAGLVNLDTLLERVEEAKENMIEALKQPIRRHLCHGPDSEQKVLAYLAEKIQKNTDFKLNQSAICLFTQTLYEQLGSGQTKLIDHFRKILTHVNETYSRYTIQQACHCMNAAHQALLLQQRSSQSLSDVHGLFQSRKKHCHTLDAKTSGTLSI
ncbi:MAG TPA: hypothetical protein DCZ80_00660 [Legionellales bacterium]|nr:hypothetical protein [Legionellales bacterium]